jgi:hypothetical protein
VHCAELGSCVENMLETAEGKSTTFLNINAKELELAI